MYFYYDVMLNFTEDKELYEFYEWEENDNFNLIKRIPLFRVSTNVLKELLTYQTEFDKEFLKTIKDKTILKDSTKTLEYVCIISDTKNALAIELDKEGVVRSRSKLLLADEINLSEMMFAMKETEFKYQKLKKYIGRKDIRQIAKMKKLIKCEINTLYESNNISKLKYIYYEWFNKTCNDLELIIKNINTNLQKDDDNNLERIYKIIKMSYNKVN